MNNKIKLIIFDFDMTIYEGENWAHWNEYLEKFLKYLIEDEKERLAFQKKYDIKYGTNLQYIVQAEGEEFGRVTRCMEFMSQEFYPLDLPHLKHLDNSYFEELSKKVKLAIVSNSSKEYVLHYLNIFGIDAKHFTYVMSNEYQLGNFSKGVNYEKIMREQNLAPDQVLVIGDSYRTDIEPALQLGQHGEQVGSIHEVKKAVNRYLEL